MSVLLDIDQAAEILNLKSNTIRIKIRKKEFPAGLFFKVGGAWRIDETDLRKFIEDLKQEAKQSSDE